MAKQNFISPDQLQKNAIKDMLEGEEPTTEVDWMKLCNYWAANTAAGLEENLCKLMRSLYIAPLSDDSIKQIAEYQAIRK